MEAPPTQETREKPRRRRVPRTQRITELKAQLEALQARESADQRKRDTREKIILGGTIKAAMDRDHELRERVLKYLHEFVTREQDRKVIAHLFQAG